MCLPRHNDLVEGIEHGRSLDGTPPTVPHEVRRPTVESKVSGARTKVEVGEETCLGFEGDYHGQITNGLLIRFYAKKKEFIFIY